MKQGNLVKNLIDVVEGQFGYVTPDAIVYDSEQDTFHVYALFSLFFAPNSVATVFIYRDTEFGLLNVSGLYSEENGKIQLGIHPHSGLGSPEATKALLPLEISKAQKAFLMPGIEQAIAEYERHRKAREGS